MSEWMNGNNFELHHWKTSSGSENKYECYWAIVIPFPKKKSLGEPVHNYITDNVEKYGELWEKAIGSAINSIMNGQIPTFRNIDPDFLEKNHIGWNEGVKENFEDYMEENEDIRDLIKSFLYF
ncbi:MAG: hypothetical protein P8Y97_20995 [Candidatus Lokiarchaeota archaeon]